MDPFQEAQKYADRLAMKQGSRSVFGLIGQLMEDIQERSLSDELKWKAWKDTCRMIEKMNAGYHDRIEGCKVAEVQSLLKIIFADLDEMSVNRFDEVLRYTEYCRRMALFQTSSNNIAEPPALKSQSAKPQNDSKVHIPERYDVSKPHCWPLIFFQLNNTEMKTNEKRQLAEQVKESFVKQGLWEKNNAEQDLKKLFQLVKKIVNDDNF